MRNGRAILLTGALAAFGLLLLREVTLGGRVLFWHDVSLAYMPLRKLAQEALQAGRLPLWTPELAGGFPLLAEGQAAVFYPLSALAHLTLPYHLAYGWLVLAQCLIAALGCVALARYLRLGWTAAAFAGLAFGFSGYFLSKALFLTVLLSGAWLPLLLLCTLAGLERGQWRWFAAGAAVLALSLLGGHPQTVFYQVLAAGVVILWWLLRPGPLPAGRKLGRAVAAGLIVLGLGAALAGAQVIPTLELAAFAESRDQPSAEFLRELSLSPHNLAYLAHPYLLGSYAHNDYWGQDHYYEVCGYVGGITLLLALVALFCRRVRLPHKGLWISLGLLGLFLALAEHNPVYELLPRVPGFNLFRAPARYLLLTSLSLPLLAGATIHGLGGRQRRGVGKAVAGWALAALLGCAALVGGLHLGRGPLVAGLARFLPPVAGESPAERLSRSQDKWQDLAGAVSLADPHWLALTAGLALALGAGLAANRRRRGRLDRAAPVLLLGVLAVQLYLFGRQANPSAPAEYYTVPPQTAAAHLALPGWGRQYTDVALEREGQALPDGYRGWASGDLTPYFRAREVLRRNLAPLHGLEAAHAEYALIHRRHQRLLKEALPAGLAGDRAALAEPVQVLRALGVKSLIAAPDLPEEGLEPVLREGRYWLYRVADPLPRAWLPRQAVACAAEQEAWQGVTGPGWRPEQTALVEGLPQAEAVGLRGADGWAELTQEEITRLQWRVYSPAPAWLALSMSYHPQWQATVNGQPARLLRSNYVQAGLAVPAGESLVALEYVPRDLLRGVRLSLGAAALLLLIALLSGRRTGRRSPQEAS